MGKHSKPEWTPDGTGVQPAVDIGGDLQNGEAHSVRFTREDRPGSLIDVAAFAEKTGDGPDEHSHHVTVMTMFDIRTDPADSGTEIASDVAYSRGPDGLTGGEANELAYLEALAYLTGQRVPPAWDGRPETIIAAVNEARS